MTQYRENLSEIMEQASLWPPLDIKVNYHCFPYELELTPQGDWVDLYVAEDTHLHEGEFKYISLGISMELPQGYEAIVAPRSSTYKRWGLIQTNSIGVIDNSYNGDNDIWMMPAHATRAVDIPAGTRLCQFRIQKKQPMVRFVSVDSLGNEDRNGLGSSGA